jgi:hypothetical protein
MKKENGYYIDDQGNKWSVNYETEKSAQKKSKSLITCRGCRGCSDCKDCSYCSNCNGCNLCNGFEENPQRITSPKIGSRNDQTTVYWTDKKDLVVCGCFKGNLKEFEERVKEVHKDTEFERQYLLLIDQVKYNMSLWI